MSCPLSARDPWAVPSPTPSNTPARVRMTSSFACTTRCTRLLGRSVSSAAKLGSEALGEGGDDARPELRRLLVRERALGRAEGYAEGERALARADLLAAVLVERLDVAQRVARGLADRVDHGRSRHVVVDDEGQILAYLGVGAHLGVRDRCRRRLDQRIEIELEPAPGSLEHARMQLAEPAVRGPRGFAGMQHRLARTVVRRVDLQCRVELLDRPLRVGEAAFDHAADMPPLARELAAGAVDARDLEQRDAGGADGHVRPRCADEAVDETGPKR